MPRNKSKAWTSPFSKPRQDCSPAGYAWLVQKYQLDVLPHWRWTFIAERHVHEVLERDGCQYHVLPPPRDPGTGDLDHLLFALRHDRVSVSICRALFHEQGRDDLGKAITAAVRRKPTGSYARRAWYLFEELTGIELPLQPIRRGNYVPLLDPDVYVTGPVRKHQRQRIDVNLLGSLDFSPVLRRTESLDQVSGKTLRARIDEFIASYDDQTIRRAVSYLHTRETMASYEIEHERPPQNRAERFISLLKEAPRLGQIDRGELVNLQNAMVDPRFIDATWCDEQSYVGESLSLSQQRTHFVCPRPEDVAELMQGYLDMTAALSAAEVFDPVLAAAVISFAFVLIHPFTDGNGRIHRWLIHWVLSRRGVTPADVVVPVSAVMLAKRREYDQALETFSAPLMQRVSYDLNADGRMTVHGATVDWYRHPDLTDMAEGLWRWLSFAIEHELPDQLNFLVGLDGARRDIQEVVDMPDRLLMLFIKLCRQNQGSLSTRKREKHFSMLTDDEIRRMEEAVREHFAALDKGRDPSAE